jgi:tRNA pseudouridine38-40 synthase
VSVPTFKVTLAYDGTGFVGWQRQAKGTSIQGLLEDALKALDDRDVVVSGAGRTDAGVHALGQVASFTVKRLIAADVLVRAVNARLPATVRVLAAEEVPASFHARFDAARKLYRYRIWNAEVLSPFERPSVWHVPGQLDLAAMREAALAVEGRHDFSAFQGAGSVTKSADREVFSSRIETAGTVVSYEIAGDGFLRHMVRNIAGSLVEVGRGRRPVEWMRSVLASRDRAQAGPTAPPQGLTLVSVEYRGTPVTFTTEHTESTEKRL